MWLTPPPSSNKSSLLFDAIIPVIPGHQNESAAVTYRPDNEEAAALIKKIRRSPPAWFLSYWIMSGSISLRWFVSGWKVSMWMPPCWRSILQIRLHLFHCQHYLSNADEQLDSAEADLGTDQGWEANLEDLGGTNTKVDVVGHREALAMTLWDHVKDVDDAACSGPSCCSDFSQSTGNSTNYSNATTRQHGLRAKALKSIELLSTGIIHWRTI